MKTRLSYLFIVTILVIAGNVPASSAMRLSSVSALSAQAVTANFSLFNTSGVYLEYAQVELFSSDGAFVDCYNVASKASINLSGLEGGSMVITFPEAPDNLMMEVNWSGGFVGGDARGGVCISIPSSTYSYNICVW